MKNIDEQIAKAEEQIRRLNTKKKRHTVGETAFEIYRLFTNGT